MNISFIPQSPVKTPEKFILGGGDSLAAREVLKHKQVQRIDLVDIDPLITEFGQSNAIIRRLNNQPKQPQANVYNDDAFSFLNSEGILYDVIIIDLPDPHNEALNKLYTKEFIVSLKNECQMMELWLHKVFRFY